MAEENKAKRNDDELLLKSMVIDLLKPWMDEKPDARTQSIVASKCPNVSTAKLSRILNTDNPACPTLEETIELLTCADKLSSLDRFIKNSSSGTGNYLRALKNWNGERVQLELSQNDHAAVLSAISDGFSKTRADLTSTEKRIQRAIGMGVGVMMYWLVSTQAKSVVNIIKIIWD